MSQKWASTNFELVLQKVDFGRYLQSLLSRKFDHRVMIVRLFNELFTILSLFIVESEKTSVVYIKADYGMVVFQYIVVSWGWWYMAGTTANILNVFLL